MTRVPKPSRLVRAWIITRAVLWDWTPELVAFVVGLVVVAGMAAPVAGVALTVCVLVLSRLRVLPTESGRWRAVRDACSERAYLLCQRYGIATTLDADVEA